MHEIAARTSWTLVTVFATLALFAGSPAAAQFGRVRPAPPKIERKPKLLAFVNVTVVPMDTERVLADQTVIVRDDTIDAVGDADAIAVPEDAAVIDGAGRFLAPGLADMHVHLWSADQLIPFIANGVTTVRNMWGRQAHLVWREQVESGERLAPTVYTTGPIVDGTPPVWPGSVGVDDPEEARRIVRRQHESGYRSVKVYNRLAPEVYAAIVETASELDLTVVGHVPDAVGLDGALAAGQACIEHLTGYLMAGQPDDSPARVASHGLARQLAPAHFDASRVPALVAATRAAGTWNCPTLVVLDRWVPPDEMAKLLETPEMRYVAPNTKAFWNPENDFRRRSMTETQYAAVKQANAIRREIVRALRDGGAGLLLGTDTPNPLVVPGFSIHEELRLLTEAGLTPFEAIAAGTRDAAVFLDASNEFGTVAPGLRADLVLLRGNPLEDVAAYRDPVGVMLRGRWLAAPILQKMLDRLAAGYGATGGGS